MYIMQLWHKCMDHGNKCIIVPHMQNKTKWPYWLVVRVTRPEPPIQVDPEPLPFRGTRFRAAQSLVFCIVLCCSLFVLWSFFSFRHCIVCQTMTFVLLDIVLSVKLWLSTSDHAFCIVCQTTTFFPLDIVFSVKLCLFSFRHCIVCQTMTFDFWSHLLYFQTFLF